MIIHNFVKIIKMLFTNPKIIQFEQDATIGCVHVSGNKISYLQYMLLVKNRLLKLTNAMIKAEMQLGNSMKPVKLNEKQPSEYNQALANVAMTIFQYLNFDTLQYPADKATTENEIVEQIMKSVEFGHWENSIYYKFMELHPDVVDKHTEVEAGGKNAVLDDMDVEKEDLLDVLQALCSAYTLKN